MMWNRVLPKPYSFLAGLAAVFVFAACTSVAGKTPREAELLNLLEQDCGSCHGLTMKGGLGKPLLPADLADRDADMLAEIILDGIPGTPMPPWRGQVSADEALWLAERLKEGLKQ